MSGTNRDYVLLWCDNVAVDTYAAALAVTDPSQPFEALGAVHVGRRMTADPAAPRDTLDFDTELTARYDRIDGQRLAGFLRRAGRDLPTYLAGPAEVHVVPRAQHIDTADLVVPGDEQQPVADLDALLARLRQVDGTIHVIGAGPLTGLDRLIDDDAIRPSWAPWSSRVDFRTGPTARSRIRRPGWFRPGRARSGPSLSPRPRSTTRRRPRPHTSASHTGPGRESCYPLTSPATRTWSSAAPTSLNGSGSTGT